MLQATITVDDGQRIGRVDRNVYGHFIEHLGRCINGGIWGEMLRGRKLVGFDDEHTGLPDPWVGGGRHDPQLLVEVGEEEGRRFLRLRPLSDDDAVHSVAHPGLAVRRGVRYELEMDVRAAGDPGEVQVRLGGAVVTRPAPGAMWERWQVELPARWDADDAALEIGCRGSGELHVRAPSLMSARDREAGGFRADVIELVRRITPPVVRWPGGCFVDAYRWRNGVGERDARPTVFDPAWRGWEPNDFGTDEFVAWCRAVGAEPYICVNTGSADAEEAAAWVQYCNGSPDTQWGAQRAENGHPEPYGVRYWSVGNETYGGWEIGNVSAVQYGRLFVEFAEAMREADPEIELIAVGADPLGIPEWNRTVLGIAGEQMDMLSVHRYVPHTRDDSQRERQYAAIVAASVDIERRLRMVAETIEEVLGADSGVGIAFDEWNVWLEAGGEDGIEEEYELRDSLFAAGVFNALQRLANEVAMANLAQLVNVLPAIRTSRTGAWMTAIGRAFELYTAECEEIAVECEVECERFDAEAFGNIPALEDVPWIDASATVSEDGSRLAIAIVNRHPREPVAAGVDVGGEVGEAGQATLTGASAEAETAERLPAALSVHRERLDCTGSPMTVTVPAHSAAVVRVSRLR